MKAATRRDRLVTENLGLVHACAKRFRGRGVEYDDLFQAGCVGLVKAADGFDETMGYRFSTYAVPAILGEIKRIFRDGGSVKASRAAKEKACRLLELREAMFQETGREPGVAVLAEAAGMDVTDAAALLGVCLPTLSLTPDEDGAAPEIPVEPGDLALTRRLDLMDAVKKLEETDRDLIRLRYFHGCTQTVTAQKLNMTQVQVSRREKRILQKLKTLLS